MNCYRVYQSDKKNVYFLNFQHPKNMLNNKIHRVQLPKENVAALNPHRIGIQASLSERLKNVVPANRPI